MVSRISKAALVVLAALVFSGAAQSVSAQSWAVTPFIGYYAPLSTIIGEEDIGADISHEKTIAFGGRLTRMLNSSWGVEASIGYSSSGLEDDDGDSVDGNVLAGSLRAIYMFPTSGTMNVYGAFGLGYVKHGGDFLDDIDGTSDIGGNLAVGAMFPVGGMMKIRVEVEDFLYSAKFDDGGIETEGKFQNDLYLTAGLYIPFGGN
jgi:hypothetical protein